MLLVELFEDVCDPSDRLVTRTDLINLEKYLDELFSRVSIDVELTGRHFMERVNDARNGRQISVCELREIFKDFYRKYAAKISKQKDGFEAVISDLSTKINLPFMLKYDRQNRELDLIAKTVMRKNNFKSVSPVLKTDAASA